MPEFIANNKTIFIILLYIAIVSVISAIVCVYDKLVSKRDQVELRVPEKMLMFLSVIGGSVAMFITMLLIRHKTKHVKFMLGIPLIMVLQATAIFALFHFGVI